MYLHKISPNIAKMEGAAEAPAKTEIKGKKTKKF